MPPYLTTAMPPALVATAPPTVDVPSAPNVTGNIRPASRAAACALTSTQPASRAMVLPTGSTFSTRFIRDRLSTTARPDPSGAAPPDKLVLPPCGTTGTPCSVQARTTAAVSAVEPGRTTARALPV